MQKSPVSQAKNRWPRSVSMQNWVADISFTSAQTTSRYESRSGQTQHPRARNSTAAWRTCNALLSLLWRVERPLFDERGSRKKICIFEEVTVIVSVRHLQNLFSSYGFHICTMKFVLIINEFAPVYSKILFDSWSNTHTYIHTFTHTQRSYRFIALSHIIFQKKVYQSKDL